MAAKERPLIAITMGDAAGIGPEIIAKALLAERIYAACRPLIIGESAAMRAAINLAGGGLELYPVQAAAAAGGRPGTIDLLDMRNLGKDDVVPGRVCRACGQAAVEYITEGARLALAGEVKALVTAPINKEAVRQASCGEAGHLELLARLTGATEYATMLVSGSLKVVHLTTHHPLRQACELVTRERILARLKLTHESFRGWGTNRPRIAVAALNPHAGEGGLFGREEAEEIGPAVREAQGLGIDARGPFSADSVFNHAINGELDAVLAMYHDQGHIPVKVHDLEKSLSIALGLPIIRTSVDHGTAYDIAGKGTADPRSLEAATMMAVRLCGRKRPFAASAGDALDIS